MTADAPLRMLLVGDSQDDHLRVARALGQNAPPVQLVQIGEDHLGPTLAAGHFDLVIIDSQLATPARLKVLRFVKAYHSKCPVILLVDTGSEEQLLKAIHADLDGFVLESQEGLLCFQAAFRLAILRSQERQAIKAAQVRYRSLLEGVPVGLYRSLPDGRIVDANAALAQILGYPDQESLLAVDALDLYLDPADRRRFLSRLQQEGSAPSYEVQLRRHDGTAFWVSDSAQAVRDWSGQVLHYEGIVEDITERKRAEEALRESEERFRTMVEQSPISIQILSPDGWTVEVNRAYVELWGLTAEDLKDYNMLRDEQARSLGITPYLERGFGGEATSIPIIEYDAWKTIGKGRNRWVQMRIYPVKDQAGRIRHVILMHEDVTERKLAEAELRRRAERLEALNAENARLLGAVTQHREELRMLSSEVIKAQEAERKRISRELHDELGQALTALRINLDALDRELSPGLAPAIADRLEDTSMLVDRTLEQVREMSLDLRPTMLDELGLVPTLRWYVNRYASRSGVEVQFEAIDLEKRLTAEVETTLYRAVQEALTNIAKHAQADRVWLRLKRKGGTVTASIRDNGRGFEAKPDAGRRDPEQGIGLLGIRERVASLGGRFTIASRGGKGTNLWIRVPAEIQALAPPGRFWDPPPAGEEGRT